MPASQRRFALSTSLLCSFFSDSFPFKKILKGGFLGDDDVMYERSRRLLLIFHFSRSSFLGMRSHDAITLAFIVCPSLKVFHDSYEVIKAKVDDKVNKIKGYGLPCPPLP